MVYYMGDYKIILEAPSSIAVNIPQPKKKIAKYSYVYNQ